MTALQELHQTARTKIRAFGKEPESLTFPNSRFPDVTTALQHYKHTLDNYCQRYNWINYTDVIEKLIKSKNLPGNYRQLTLIDKLNNKGLCYPAHILKQNRIVIENGIAKPLEQATQAKATACGLLLVEEWEQHDQLTDFYNDLPAKPYCSYAKGDSKIRKKDHAIDHAYIQPNHPMLVRWLWFDIDQPNAKTLYQEKGLPAPQVIVENPANGHAHYGYKLTTPVALYSNSHKHPIDYANAVERAMCKELGADLGFNGNRIKNPCSPEWDTYLTGAKLSYTLGELAQNLTLPKKSYNLTQPPANDEQGYIGRNKSTFDYVRHLAYKIAEQYSFSELLQTLLDIAQSYQEREFTGNELALSELITICKSIAKFCKSARFGGDYSKQAKLRFSDLQRNRVNKGRWQGYKQKRNQALELAETGLKGVEICLKLAISKMTLHRWKVNDIKGSQKR